MLLYFLRSFDSYALFQDWPTAIVTIFDTDLLVSFRCIPLNLLQFIPIQAGAGEQAHSRDLTGTTTPAADVSSSPHPQMSLSPPLSTFISLQRPPHQTLPSNLTSLPGTPINASALRNTHPILSPPSHRLTLLSTPLTASTTASRYINPYEICPTLSDPTNSHSSTRHVGASFPRGTSVYGHRYRR